MTTRFRDVRIPEELCVAAEKEFATKFGGLEAWLIFVLKALLEDKTSALDHAEQQMIEARLRDLGYI
jgi:hypothetical protein